MTAARRHLVVVASAGLLLGSALTGCTTSHAATGLEVVPLSASADAGSTGLATLAMGNQGTPDQTFWELFARDGTGRWALVTPPDIATNGGVTATQGGGRVLTAGVLPSIALTFSPIARSSDLGRTWVAGVLPAALAAAPDVVSIEGTRTYAVLRSGHVVVSRGTAGAAWSAVATLHTIGAAANSAGCHLISVTALVAERAGLVAGGRCASAARLPVFAETGGTWRLIGPSFAASSPAVALRLVATTGGLVTVVERGSGSSRGVVAAELTGGTWSTSDPFHVSGTTLVSTAVRGDEVAVVLSQDGNRTVRTWTPGSGPSWGDVALPAGTSDVAWTPSGALQALVVSGAVLTVLEMTAAHTWEPVQHILVPISIGPSH